VISPAKTLAIATKGIRQMTRDWTNLFFIFVFPLVLIMVIGVVFGGGFDLRLGVVAPDDDPLADEVVDTLRVDEDVDLTTYSSASALRTAVERGNVDGGLIVPDDYSDALRSGRAVEVGFLTGQNGLGAFLRPTIEDATRRQSVEVQAARFAAEHGAGDFDTALDQARTVAADLPELRVESVDDADANDTEDDQFVGLGQFDLGASQQLVLFMFLSGIAGSAALIQSRQLGVSRRMLSTPTSVGTVLAGEALGRLLVILLQGVYIVTATWVVFDVNWGDPVAALLLVLAFSLVATGVAMVCGAVFRNDQQASSVGIFLGIGVAALGGCMVPLDLFTGTMRTVAHVTPHAWVYDAFAELVRHDGGLVDVLPNLAVLFGMAVASLALATHLLRKKLTAP
jgi:ABC-2 type transport system permease protein